MKKLILSLVFVLATGSTFMNANNSNEVRMADCFQDAWDFGTEEGGGDETEEWYHMNNYYTYNCM